MTKVHVTFPVGKTIDTVLLLQLMNQDVAVMDVFRRFYFSPYADRNDAYNSGIQDAIANECEYILFWELCCQPLYRNALHHLLTVARAVERVGLISAVEEHSDEARRVFMGDPGFMLARTEVFDRLPADTYMLDGVHLKRHFTDDDVAFADRCAAAGVQWYAHGGAVIERIVVPELVGTR